VNEKEGGRERREAERERERGNEHLKLREEMS
jgi:hypothetical protein